MRLISLTGRYVRDGQPGRLKNAVNKAISVTPILALVALIIELHAQDRLQGLHVAQQEVHVLSVNLVAVDAVLAVISCLSIEEVTQPHFGRNHRPVPNRVS